MLRANFIEVRVRDAVRDEMRKRLASRKYLSKSYRAYLSRFRRLHCLEYRQEGETPIEAFGRVMNEHLIMMASRPGFARLMLDKDSLMMQQYREDQAKIKEKVDHILAQLLPYDRRLNYDRHCIGGHITDIDKGFNPRYGTSLTEIILGRSYSPCPET